MTDLKCDVCGYSADRVQNISWHDGHSWAEVTVFCIECDLDTTHSFRDPYITDTHQYETEEVAQQ